MGLINKGKIAPSWQNTGPEPETSRDNGKTIKHYEIKGVLIPSKELLEEKSGPTHMGSI